MDKHDVLLLASLVGCTGLVGAIELHKIFGDKSYRSGEILGDNETRPVLSDKNNFFAPTKDFPGHVSFQYRGRIFYDFGFDGDCDLITFNRADDKGIYGFVELKPEDIEFQDHLPLYFEAREIVTSGRIE